MTPRASFVLTIAAMAVTALPLSGIVLAVQQPEASEVSPDDQTFFELKVRPLLAEHCFECHGADKQKGGLRLDSRESILTGGESGPAIDSADHDASVLLSAVKWESYEMPPGGKLPEASIAILEDWIRRGAPWPGSTGHPAAVDRADKGFTDDDRAWWAIQPVQDHAVPTDAADAWSRNEIDRFIHHAQQREGLHGAPEADQATLIRRLSFDLIGLPPTPAEVQAFLDDERPDAYEQLVDQLLASPRYGERQARQWLDVVRYAESDGYRIDHYRPDAWRYRDYVIQSFNSDKPYDRFVQEQLAGDELFPDHPDALVATGYLRHWIYEYNNRDAFGQWDTILNEVTDTTGDVFLGVGMQCARCHDHKFDPILQKDYFRLQAYFAAMIPDDRHIIASTAEQDSHREQLQQWEAATADIRTRIDELERPFREKARLDAISKFPPDVQALLTSTPADRDALEHQVFDLAWRQIDYEYDRLETYVKGDDKDRLLALRRELLPFDTKKPAPLPTALVMKDVSAAAPHTVIPKKNVSVAPGVLSLLDPADATITPPAGSLSTTGRRSALARWLTSPDNPLSTRVIVNRIWQSHFGRGLAQNASDFGTLGGPPSHPELLDWLTLRFVRGGWQIKDLHRLIVTSATYRQAAEHPQLTALQLKDPSNKFYWRSNTRRLDAEQIRDAILMVSGQLDPTAGGPGVQSDVPRRSIYLRVMRNERDSLLDGFDLPQFFASSSSRDSTTTPIQSLLLFNSQIVLNHASKLATALTTVEPAAQADRDAQNVTLLWERAFGRQPSAEELAGAREFLATQMTRIEHDRAQSETAAVPIGRLPYRDGQAVIVTPGEKPLRMAAESNEQLNPSEFTIEACFQLRSIQDNAAVRTIAAKWNGQKTEPGWSFGITGRGSRRKPQTLVLQLFGHNREGQIVEAALFSDHTVQLDVPYFAAVSIRPATADKPGIATFHLKDLSNDDELLSTVTMEHEIVGAFSNDLPLMVGARVGSSEHGFDGVMDDVRLSSTELSADQLLLTSDATGPHTLAFWRFEPVPGLLDDSSPSALRLRITRSDSTPSSPADSAFADLCHIVLNSSEFLYVR